MTHLSRFRTIRRSFGLACLALGAAVAPLQGQGLEGYATNAMTAMRKNEWAEALALLTRATEAYDARAKRVFGPRFGWFWYRRGIAELKMAKYRDAMVSFKKCYEDYSNKGRKRQGSTNKEKTASESYNVNEKMALLYWGHAAKASGEWKIALEKYKKFLAERDPTRDKYQPGVFYLNNAVCNFKLKKFKEGSDFLEAAIKNRIKYKTPNKGIMSAFAAMVESVIEKKAEPVLLDFLSKNRGHVKLSPFEAYEYAPLFMKLAQKAKEVGMLRTTSELYALVPSTQAAVADVQFRLDQVGAYPATISDGAMNLSRKGLTEDLEALEGAQTKGTVNEVYALMNTAVMHEDDGNVRGAFASYEQLEHYFPKAKVYKEKVLVPMRERNLYNLVRTASSIGEVMTTEKYGSRFLKAFPTSKYVPDVRRLMLTSLFWNGEYETCIKVASVMIDELPKPSKGHDICLFVLGGSYYYEGQFVEAMPLLNQHVQTYPKADKHRRQAVLYYQASNTTRFGDWQRSAALLDAFLKLYPDRKTNVYMPFALYDRANTHYAMDETKEALDMCTQIEKNFQGVEIMEMNYNLKGNALELLKDRKKSEVYHKKALVLAETKENKMVAGEALYYLVRLIGPARIDNKENPRMTEAVPFYEKFWEEHGADSPYQAQVAVAGFSAMKKVDREKEALERLQGVITNLSKSGSDGLEKIINSYTEFYLASHSPEELKKHYYAFPGVTSEDHATRALLRIAVINVYEKEASTMQKDPDKAKDLAKANAQIKVLFTELRNAFDPKDLSPYILVSLGEFLRTKTSAPKQATRYYDAALKREGHEHKYVALFGIADVLGRGTAADKKKAVMSLQEIYDSAEKKDQKERALSRMVSVLYEMGDYGRAIEKAREYLKNTNFRKYNLNVRLAMADSYKAKGSVEDAITIYAQIWPTAQGYIKISAPAIRSWLQLLWDRNRTSGNKSDRQFAYEGGWNYVNQTKKFKLKLEGQELKDWTEVESLVADYEASSDTKSMEQIRKESAEK